MNIYDLINSFGDDSEMSSLDSMTLNAYGKYIIIQLPVKQPFKSSGIV
jgi:hypothetical protein